MEDKREKVQKLIKVLFIIRVCLWITCFIPTIHWIYYSFKLTYDGIFDPFEYAAALRPVLYPCLGISLTALCVSFALHAVSKRFKEKYNLK